MPPCTTPATPTVTTTGATCTSAGTATISNFNFALTYTFSPSGPSVAAGGVISGLTAGTSYTVTAADGSCTATSTSFRVAAQLWVPTATVSSTSPICSGQNAVFTIAGTTNAVVTYTLNGGANTNVTLSSTGTATVTVNGATANQTLTLVSVNNPTTKCSATLSGSSTVTESIADGDGKLDFANMFRPECCVQHHRNTKRGGYLQYKRWIKYRSYFKFHRNWNRNCKLSNFKSDTEFGFSYCKWLFTNHLR